MRGGRRVWDACEGSLLMAIPGTSIYGKCQCCGKELVLVNGRAPRHKELSRIVQGWRDPEERELPF